MSQSFSTPYPQLGKQSLERWGLSVSSEGLEQNKTKDRKTRAASVAWPSKVQVESSLSALAPENLVVSCVHPPHPPLKRAQQAFLASKGTTPSPKVPFQD